jgi:hypothetical protein
MFLIVLIMLSYSKDINVVADKYSDVFTRVSEITEGIPEESIIRVTFREDNLLDEYYLNLLDKLKLGTLSEFTIHNIRENGLEFNNKNLSGYIESMRYDNYNVVIIQISIKSSSNVLSELKKKMLEAIGEDKKDFQCYQNLKIRTFKDDIKEVNNDITELLKTLKSRNIDTIQMENGFSSVANTKRYNSIVNNGKQIDFNYAVCTYTTGNYVIVGTPIIITAY